MSRGSLAICSCLTPHQVAHDEVLKVFGTLRASCPALQLLVPDSLWPKFAAWDTVGDNDAFHRSIALLALERGTLSRLTGPLHRFLLDSNRPRTDLRSQYVRDLREDWLFDPDPLERHRRSSIYMGRLTELQIASWLESEGWSVTGLEALRKGPDIEATRAGRLYAFEVKAISSQSGAFAAILKSLRNQPGAIRWGSPEGAANYALFRAYQGAHQLCDQPAARVAILAIDHMAWGDFELPMREGWIDWRHPAFLPADREWDRFLQEEEGRYPEMRSDLSKVIGSLDEIWIVQRQSGFDYRREHVIRPRYPAPE